MIEFFIGFVVLLTLVTLVGHGLWLFFARVFRSLQGPATPLFQQHPESKPEISELLAARRRIARLRQSNALDRETGERVTEAIDRELERFGIPRPQSPVKAEPPVVITEPAVPRPTSGAEGNIATKPADSQINTAPTSYERVNPEERRYPFPDSRTPISPSPVPPRKPLSDVLASFMEERNIRWGELIGAAVVVVSAIALVISLRHHIAANPAWRVLLFVGVNSLIFAAGALAHGRLALPLTGRLLLILATLLVPLNVQAASAFWQAGVPSARVGEWVAVAAFTGLVVWAGRVIAQPWVWALAMGVIVPAGWQLLLRDGVNGQTGAPALCGYAAVPVLGFLVANFAAIALSLRWRGMGRAKTHILFSTLGLSGFSTLTATALAVALTERTGWALREISPLIALMGLPPLALGLMLIQRLTSRHVATLRTAALAVAVVGAAAMAMALVFAWPQPSLLFITSLITAVSLALLGLLLNGAPAMLPAGLAAGVAYLLGVHMLRHTLGWRVERPVELLDVLLSAESGAWLCGAAAALGAGAWGLLRARRSVHARFTLYAAMTISGVSLVLVSIYGFGRVDDAGATWVYLYYTALAMAAANPGHRYSNRCVWLGCLLLFAAVVHGLEFRYVAVWENYWPDISDQSIRQSTLLIYGSLLTGVLLAWVRLGRDRLCEVYSSAMSGAALIVTTVAAGMLLLDTSATRAISLAPRVVWLGALLLAHAWMHRNRWLLTAFEASTGWAALLWATDWADGRGWTFQPRPDLRLLQTWGVTLAGIVWFWMAARAFINRIGTSPHAGDERFKSLFIFNPSSHTTWYVCTLICRGLLLVMALYGVLHGIGWELSARATSIELAADLSSSHYQAYGLGSWWLLAALMVIGVSDRLSTIPFRFGPTMLLRLAFCACLLLSGPMDSHNATASALRWWLTGLWVAAAGLLLRGQTRDTTPDRKSLRMEVLTLTALPIIGLTLYPLWVVFDGRSFNGPTTTSFFTGIGFTQSYAWPVIAMGCGFFAMAWRWNSVAFAWATAAMLHLTVTIAWVGLHWKLERPTDWAPWIDLIHLNAIALALPAAVMATSLNPTWKTFSQPASVLGASVVIATTFLGLLADLLAEPYPVHKAMGGGALLASLAAVGTVFLFDRPRGASGWLYLLGLCVPAWFVGSLDLEPRWCMWSLVLLCGAYTVLTGVIGRWRPLTSSHVVAQMSVLLNWFVIVAGLGLTLSWDAPEGTTEGAAIGHRMAMALGVMMTAVGAAASHRRPRALRYAAWAAVAFAWAWQDPDSRQADLLHRLVLFMTAVGAAVAMYGLGLVKVPRVSHAWADAAKRSVKQLTPVAAGALLSVVAAEAVYQFDRGSVPMVPSAVLIVILAHLAMGATAVAWAVLPGRDPFGLAMRGRTLYVYAAEALLALLFVHIRFTMPELFRGRIAPYWPLIVMAIAFLGVGLGEFFRRKRVDVLAGPLEKTGAFLPLLPVLGFWVAGSEVHYSVQLVLVGMLYAVLSLTRRSFGFGLLAALAANGGLWYLLNGSEGVRFHQHPQLWLIPLALCVLLATHLNRANLPPQQTTTLRYLCMMAIYVSSTADIFIAGVARSPWLPIVLAALSVAGVLAGMAWRIRSFLFLGSAFLALALLTMVAHAATRFDATWIWWAVSILLGLAMIGFFATFEKKRAQFIGLLDHLKSWDA